MKKQTIINLVRYHAENNEEAFAAEVSGIAREFEASGDSLTAQHLMELIANANYYIPQSGYKNLRYMDKIEYSASPLFLPEAIEEDIMGIVRTISGRGRGLSKFLFYGVPGSGKTESACQIARLSGRDILYVNMEQLIDSRLGETAKNVSLLFDEMNHLPYNQSIVLFDEIDALVLNRISQNDLREMGRVTTAFLKGLDSLNSKIVMIATTNLYSNLDKALIRRFDAVVSFDRYTREERIEIANALLAANLKSSPNLKKDTRLFNKILRNLEMIPYPGDMRQIIRSAIAFSDETNKYDYLRRIYLALHGDAGQMDIQKLGEAGYTTREIEILSRISRSSVSRKLRELK